MASINYNFNLTLEESTILETIINAHIADYHEMIMLVMDGEDKVGTVEAYKSMQASDRLLKEKIFKGVSEQVGKLADVSLETDTQDHVWVCCECGKRDVEADVIVDHLMSYHRYPEEDANLGTEKVYL